MKRNNNKNQESDLPTTIQEVCQKFGKDKRRLMDILWEIQNEFGCVSGEAMKLLADELSSYRVEIEGMVSFYSFFSDTPKGKIVIRLCDDIIDRHAGVEKVSEIFSQELGLKIGETSADGKFSLEYTPCIGMCDQAPAALINEVVVTQLTPQSAREIAQQLKENQDLSALTKKTGDGNNSHPLIHSSVNNNIRLRGKVLLCEGIPPEAGLKKALEKTPKEVIQEITNSGLRGRGGAGFPTGLKWKLAYETEAEKRFVICNADEGEPGTFKDRVLLTERANLLIEGMTIAAHAIGSQDGIIYLRAEYWYLLPYLESVLQERRKQGLLGKNILGKKEIAFDIRIQMGAGAYICGEESSLISSCEGLRGEPKNRPPFPAKKGYLGYPTIVNNLESFCAAARILEKGSSWFSSIGTEKSKGTKLLSVCGDCKEPGIYEVAWGVSIDEILEQSKAEDTAIVQVGGASGDMIGRTAFHRKIAFEDLPTAGAIMVFHSRRNVLKIVDYFLEFFVEESCGYCTPCRVGNVFLRERVQKIMQGFAEESDLEYLKDLSQSIIATSRCGLGHTSPKPVLGSMEHFPLVYSSLIKENKDGLQSSFNIQNALAESRRIAKRRSMIYDPTYDENEN